MVFRLALLLLLASIPVHHHAFAQTTAKSAAVKSSENKTPAAHSNSKSAEKDTLAYNIKTTFAKLSALATNEDIPAEAFFSSYLGKNADGQPEYASGIIAPNSVENKVQRIKVDWEQGTVRWQWRSTLLRYPQNQEPEERFTSAQVRINQIINGLPEPEPTDPKSKVLSFIAVQNVTDLTTRREKPNAFDELTLEFEFIKPIGQTQQQYIDSLISIYRPGFNSIGTAADAYNKFSSTLAAEGFSNEKIKDAQATVVAAAANRDIRLAYVMLMATDRANVDGAKAKLSADQRSKIAEMAQAFLDAYKAGEDFDVKTYDPNPPVKTFIPYTEYAPAVNPLLNQAAQPAGEKVSCAVCSGTGWMDEVEYSHTYYGISGNYTTTIIKKVKCTFCNGTGTVFKVKKRKN